MDNLQKEEVERIIEETTHYDFPFLASREKKQKIIMEKKYYIEKQYEEISADLVKNKVELQEIWNEAVEYADEQFKPLSEKNRLNGFYLQEIMHCYVEKICQEILDNI